MLSNNSLIGGIPQCLMELSSNLVEFILSMNSLEGPKLETLAPDKCSLKAFDLSQNHFGGKLPRFLANCSKLEVLDLSNNEFKDTFPNWLEALPTLYVLVLRFNKFHGPICSSGLTIQSF